MISLTRGVFVFKVRVCTANPRNQRNHSQNPRQNNPRPNPTKQRNQSHERRQSQSRVLRHPPRNQWNCRPPRSQRRKHRPPRNQRPNPSKESSFTGASTTSFGVSIQRISVARQRVLQRMTRGLQRLPNKPQSCRSTGTSQLLKLMTISEDSARVSFDSAGHSSIYPFLFSLQWHMDLGSRGLLRV